MEVGEHVVRGETASKEQVLQRQRRSHAFGEWCGLDLGACHLPQCEGPQPNEREQHTDKLAVGVEMGSLESERHDTVELCGMCEQNWRGVAPVALTKGKFMEFRQNERR